MILLVAPTHSITTGAGDKTLTHTHKPLVWAGGGSNSGVRPETDTMKLGFRLAYVGFGLHISVHFTYQYFYHLFV